MRTIPLHEIITAHTDALAAHFEEFLPMIRLLLLLRAGPVSPEQLATAMNWTASEVEAFLPASGLVVDADGHIQIVAGSGCALDTLLAPMLTGQTVRVVSVCPATGKQIQLTVTPEGIRDLNAPDAVVSLRLPQSVTRASNAPATICAYGHFFIDRAHASTWPGLHPEAVLLSVRDAARLARALAEAARKSVEAATS